MHDFCTEFDALEVILVLHLNEDIRSLSEFKRNSQELMQHLRESGRPMVLTVNGKAQMPRRPMPGSRSTAPTRPTHGGTGSWMPS